MATQCNPILKFGGQVDLAVQGAGTIPINLTANDRTGPVLKSTTTPPVTKVVSLSQALSGGAATVTLTSLSYEGDTVDLTGLKIQVLKLKNESSNAITVSEGASNGYAFNGGNDIVVPAGGECFFVTNETNPDVAAGDATLDLAGTGTDTLLIEIAAG